MSQCKTCRHWGDQSPGDDEFKCCGKIEENGRFPVRASDCLAYVYGIKSAWIQTSAEFGCVLHEPIPGKEVPA